MAINKDIPDSLSEIELAARPEKSDSHPLHEAAMRLAEIGLSRPKTKSTKTKDLIGLLISHGARAWRYSQPNVRIRLRVTSPSKRLPVNLKMR